jgi:NAD(P)-dependent dehydrogenase (short-subunit alcohol dehydrogenase family)
LRLKDKVALVTGGTHGIGEAITRRFAAEGAKVAINYSSDDGKANALLKELKAGGREAAAFKADCSKLDHIDEMVRNVIKTFGTINILVNNAGIFRVASLEETTEELWDDQLDLNLKGAFFMIKAVVPEFKRGRGGKIINITSIAAVVGIPNCSTYCASKAGLGHLTMALATELAKSNINVNAIAPGNIRTRVNEPFRKPGMEAFIQRLKDMTPTGRDFLETSEVTGAAVFLASDDANATHGHTIMVDDGWTAW